MKNTLLFLSLLISFFAKGQNYEQYGKTNYYELNRPTYILKNTTGTDSILADARLKFTIINTTKEGDYLIQFWKWAGEKNLDKAKIYNYKDVTLTKDNKINDDESNLLLFRTTAAKLKNSATPYYNAGFQKGSLDWSIGIVVLPIKVRKKPNYTYSKDISLGLSGGGKMRISHRNPTFVHALYNVGISSVSVDSLSTEGRTKQPTNLAAFSTSLGLVLENHAFQFGLFYGWDKLTDNDSKRTGWIYNKKPWLSFGIGYQIFSADKNNKNAQAGTQSK